MTEEEKLAAEKAAKEKADAEAAERAKLLEGKDKDLITQLVAERVNAELKDIKSNLDKAYAARDEALKKAEAIEKAKREEDLKRLEAEGKHQEALQQRLVVEQAEAARLKEENTKLSRDVAVKDALQSLPFRNSTAADMAYREVTNQLVQDKDGKWMHRSGISIKDFVEAFAKSEEQSFLFKAKQSSGSGSPAEPSGSAGGGSSNDKPKSLFAIPQSEVLKMAMEGKLPNQKTGTGTPN